MPLFLIQAKYHQKEKNLCNGEKYIPIEITKHIVLAAVLGAVSLVSIPITRSIMSRLVKADEQGT